MGAELRRTTHGRNSFLEKRSQLERTIYKCCQITPNISVSENQLIAGKHNQQKTLCIIFQAVYYY